MGRGFPEGETSGAKQMEPKSNSALVMYPLPRSGYADTGKRELSKGIN
jgi:hypothetical protein